MTSTLFSVLLVVIGLSSGLLQLLVTYICFASANRLLIASTDNSKPLSFKHLIVYVLATLLAGVFFIGVVLVVVSWTNGYPQWADNKYLFWVGILGTFILNRILKDFNSRHSARSLE